MMMWLLRWVLAVWLLLSVIGGSVLLMARDAPAPGRLQALGFSMCNGESCFRGIKVGMDWGETQRLVPEGTVSRSEIILRFEGIDEHVTVFVSPSRDKKTVSSIRLEADLASSPPTVADLVQYLGYPCAVQPVPDPGVEINRITLIYTQVRTLIFQRNSRLRPDSPINSLTLQKPRASKPCAVFYNDLSPWYGFTSADVYLVRYQRVVGTAR
jgi:hypothetical protein